MKVLLSSYANTVPSNYRLIPLELIPELALGESLTEEAWDKHERQCSPFYEWWDYKKRHEDVLVLLDHPVYAKRMQEQATITQWNDLLNELEPFNEYA